MKKSILPGYILLIAASLLMAACTADDSSDGQESNAIRYHVEMQSETRSVVSGTSLPEDGSFLLYAVKSREGAGESVLIDGDEVSCTNHVWRTSTTYYWPFNSYTVDFYAVYPFGAPFDKDSKTLVYTTEQPVTGSDDVMFAYTTSSREEASTIGYAAELCFNHVMTQVKISGYKKEADWTVIVKDITLCNINSAGTYSPATGEWSGVSTPTTYALDMANELALTSTDKESPILLTGSDGPLMLIPQQQTAWDGSEAASSTAKSFLRIECSITDGNGIQLVGTESAFGYAYVPFPVDWTASKACSYVLGFGAGLDKDGKPQVTVNISISNAAINGFESSDSPDLEGEAECNTNVMDASGNIIGYTDGGSSVNGDGYEQGGTLPSVDGEGTITDHADGGDGVKGGGYEQGGTLPSVDGNGTITDHADGGDGVKGDGYEQGGTLPSVDGNGIITGYTDGGNSVNGGAYSND